MSKELPILFSGAMVRALLDGTKTQTRRVVKGAALEWMKQFNPAFVSLPENHMCPYGNTGDRLWVRETWGVVSNDWDEHGNLIDWAPNRPATPINEMPFGKGYYSGHVIYAADGDHEWAGDDDGGGEPRTAWHPSIHMPRLASRILLEIVGVRVERLNDISEADALAEGIDADELAERQDSYDIVCKGAEASGRATAQSMFRELWESISGAGSWDANPWVWVVQFKRVTQ